MENRRVILTNVFFDKIKTAVKTLYHNDVRSCI